MLPSSACRPWQPEQAANAAQDGRSYTTPWGTIRLRRQCADDRQHLGARASACRELKKSHPDRCMGRSRGGLTTKVHALVDANGLPLELILTPGQAGDCPVAEQLLGRLDEGTIVLADKAYDADWLRRQIEAAGAAPNIPPMVHRR